MEQIINLFGIRPHLIVMGNNNWIINLIKKKHYIVLLLFSFLFLAFFCGKGQSRELNEDLNKGKPFILILYPKLVTIQDSNGVNSLLLLINLGNSPISLGRFNPETGSMIDGNYELRVSLDISNSPLRYMQLGGQIAASNDNPFASASLVSGVTLMPGSGLWMILTALPMENIEKPEEGFTKFSFTLLSLADGKIKTLSEIGFSIRYKTGEQLDETRHIQASIETDKQIPNLKASN